jgi:hypothetical protein
MRVVSKELGFLTKYHFTARMLVLPETAEIRPHLAGSLAESTPK